MSNATEKIRQNTDVEAIFPNRAAIIRLFGAVLAEQNDEPMINLRYDADTCP